MKYYKFQNELETVTIFYESDRLYQIVIEKNDEIPVGSIVHARVKKIDNKARLTFVDIGETEDAFCAEKTGLKSGADAFFNIRKTPDEEKFYTVDMDLKLEKNSSMLRIIPKKSGAFETKFENFSSIVGSRDGGSGGTDSGKSRAEKNVSTKSSSGKNVSIESLSEKSIENKNSDRKNNETKSLTPTETPTPTQPDAVEESLIEKWRQISSMKNTLPIPKIVYKAPTKSEKLIEEYNAERSIDKEEVAKVLKKAEADFERRVDMKTGYLYVDTLPYMTIVDVNSGDFSEFFDSALNRMEVNKDAMRKLAKIIKLRNLEGVIIMDILKLPGKVNREFLEYLKSEYTEINFHDITRLGMLEMTIKKTGGEKISREKISELKRSLENI
ncbi:MAG: ribonuclease E/G [Ezakiella sp.]|uniref:ribonuclease E/G n=1 Tax=Ezakiella sp. TaxID=1935205 RepID=UPI00297256B6|nr:ribonuclease E/G [Ezakiella sp.]MDD7731486.1 ribonuclease E/G [Eubacteriales bacterium]MDY6079301.1 ribonuclease E/G [Ezakiella sp.]